MCSEHGGTDTNECQDFESGCTVGTKERVVRAEMNGVNGTDDGEEETKEEV